MTRKSKKIKYSSDEELGHSDEDEEVISHTSYDDHFDEVYDLYLELRKYCDDFILPLLDRLTGADFYEFVIEYS